jgi:hypothetical protein
MKVLIILLVKIKIIIVYCYFNYFLKLEFNRIIELFVVII